MLGFWLMVAGLTAIAVMAVLWPLSRARGAAGPEANDLAVYKDQLEEIGRDRDRGLIGEAEAEAARIEVSRRLIAAAEQADARAGTDAAGTRWRRRMAAIVALVGMPAVAGAIYAGIGSPELRDQPLQARLEAPVGDQPFAALLARVEGHLARNPEDGRGWEVLAPVYMRMGRVPDAVQAYLNVIRLLGPSADRSADLGEALVAQASGVVTAEAKTAFLDAIARDRRHPKARYFVAVAAEQDGRPGEALVAFRALLADTPADAAWRPAVERAITRIAPLVPVAPLTPSAPAPAPAPPVARAPFADPGAAGAIAGLPQDQQNAMIRGMVDRLAGRLAADGSDVEGWIRLFDAYVVLGERDRAAKAAADARRALAADPAKLERLEGALRGRGFAS
jgi:cytochrome c-type biogenesis protein CcmH